MEECVRNRRAICFFLFLSVVFAAVLVLLSVRQRRIDPGTARFFAASVTRADSICFSRMTAAGVRERVSLVRTSGKWRLESPVAAEADESAVKRLLDALVFSERGDALSARDMEKMGRTLRDFALAVPAVELTVSSGMSRESFAFGRKTPSGGEYYARREGVPGIFTVPAAVVEEIMRPAGDFRRRNLFTLAPRDVIGIGVKNAGDAFTKVARADGSWRLSEPADAPADGKAADAMVEALCSAQVIEYTDASPGTGRGLNEDEGCSVSLRGSLGELERVLFGSSAGTGTVWALTGEGAVVQVSAALKELCLSGRKALEDTRMFPVAETAVRTVSVSEGFPAYVVSRTDVTSPWRLVSPVDAPADGRAVEKLLSQVLSVRGGDVAGPNDSGTYTVAVGTTLTNFPACTVVSESVGGAFRLQDLRDKTLIRYPASKIRKITVRTSAGSEWDSTASEELKNALENGVAAESVVTVSPSAEDFAKFGFHEPSYTITLTLDDESSALRRLLVGASAPGGGRYAAVGGSDAVFAVSADTVSVLTRPAEKVTEKNK